MLALIKDSNIVSTFPAHTPRVDLPGVGQVSPPVDGWEDHGFRIAAVTPAVIPEGHRIVSGPTYALVDGVPVQSYETEEIQPVVPDVLTPRQARRALNYFGYRAAVDAYVATLSQDEQDDWEYALEVRRDNPIIAAGAAALGLTPQQIDDLFTYGAGVE